MAQPVAYLEAVVGMDITNFRRGAWKVRNELGLLADNTKGFMAIGRDLSYTLTVPIAAAGATMTAVGAIFDKEMRNINSIAGLTETEFQNLRKEVVNFGVDTSQGVNEAARALYTVYSAGVTGGLAFDVMQVATKTAEAGLADMTVTTEGLVATMLSYGYTTEKEAWRVSNSITRMVQIGVGSMQEFVGSVATFTPSASALNVTVEESFALAARLTQMGYSAAEASVRVNAAMRSMIKPTDAMKEAFNKLGVSSTKELIKRFGGLTEAVIALRGTTSGTEEELAAMFSDTRALQGVLLMTQNIDATRKAIKSFKTDLDSATTTAWTQQTQSIIFQLGRLKSSFEGVSVVIADDLIKAFTPLIRNAADFLSNLVRTNPELIKQIAAFAGITAAIPPIVWAVQGFISALNPITIALGLIASNAFGMRDAVVAAFNAIIEKVQPALDLVNEFFTAVFNPTQPKTTTWDSLFPDKQTIATGAAQVQKELEINIGEGVYLWDLYHLEGEWKDTLQMKFPTYDEFLAYALEQMGVNSAQEIQLGQSFTFTIGTQTEQQVASEAIKIPTIFNQVLAAGFGLATNPKETLNRLLPLDKIQPFARAFSEGVSKGVGNPLEYAQSKVNEQWWERLIPAANDLWTKLQPVLSTLWTDFTNWLTGTAIPEIDRLAGTGISALANIFSGTVDENGDTAFYRSIKALLQGDINKALNELGIDTTGLDNAIARVFGNEGMFANTRNALSTLFTNVGTWLMNEAIPTASRIAGLFAGTFVKTLGDVLNPNTLILLVGGGLAVIGETIAQPFAEGFSEAESLLKDFKPAETLAGTVGVQNQSPFTKWAESFGQAIGDALALYFAGATFINMLRGKGIMSAMSASITQAMSATGLTSVATTFAKYVAGILISPAIIAAVIGAALGKALYDVIGKEAVEQAIQDILYGGDGGQFDLASFRLQQLVGMQPQDVNTLQASARTWALTSREKLQEAFDNEAATGKQLDFYNTILDYAADPEKAKEAWQKFKDGIYTDMLGIDNTFEFFNPTNMGAQNIKISLTPEQLYSELENSAKLASEYLANILSNPEMITNVNPEGYNLLLFQALRGITDADGNIKPEAIQVLQEIVPNVQLVNEDGGVYTAPLDELMTGLLEDGVLTQYEWWTYVMPTLTLPEGQAVDTTKLEEGIEKGVLQSPIDAMLPIDLATAIDEAVNSVETQTAIGTVGGQIVGSLGTAIANSMSADGVVDKQKIIDSVVTPVNEALTPAFGSEGTLQLLFTGFTTHVATKLLEVEGIAQNFKNNTVGIFTEGFTQLLIDVDIVKLAFTDLADKISHATGLLAIFLGLATGQPVTIPVPSYSNVGQSTSGGQSSTVNNVTINGTSSPREIKEMLKREGIRL